MPLEVPYHVLEAAGEAIIQGRGFDVEDTPLRSGEISPFYVNMRRLRSSVVNRDVVVDAMQTAVDEQELDFVADVPTAMTPLVTLLANRLILPQLTPRLDNKEYGSGDKIDGTFAPGEKGVLWEDTTTTGGSMLAGLKVMTDAGLDVTPYVIIDREQGGLENIRMAGYKDAQSLLTVSQLLRIGQRIGKFDQSDLSKCYRYIEQKQKAI